MFSFGDALGKFLVATYAVGQLLWLRACAALLVLSPLIWRHRATIPSARAAEAAGDPHYAVDARGRGVLPRHRLSAARRCHRPIISPVRSSSPRCRRSCCASRSAGGAGRAILIGFGGVLIALRPSAQTVSWPAHDRARRQPVVLAADADHAIAARHARYRDGDLAIRRHVSAGRADVAVRLGDAECRQPRAVCRRRLHLGQPRSSASTAR